MGGVGMNFRSRQSCATSLEFPAQLQSYAKELIQLVSVGNSLALCHSPGLQLQPVVWPSVQAVLLARHRVLYAVPHAL
jgi:hypothetical protein